MPTGLKVRSKDQGMIYAITYDLKAPGRNYDKLHAAITSCGAWWHFLDSTWLVDTTLGAAGIWARLEPHIDQNDNLLVVSIGTDRQGWLPKEAWDWITARSSIAA